MRKMLLIVASTGLTVCAGTGDAFAQFRLNVGRRWGTPGISIGGGNGGYYAPDGHYGNQWYGPYYQSHGNSYAPRYYYATPDYFTEPRSVAPATLVRRTYYAVPAAAQESVSMRVLVPTADTQVWFDDRLTAQTGIERLFHSSLAPNQTFTYTIKARWMDAGQAVNQERQVNVQAGQNVTVNFRERSAEDVPALLPQSPAGTPPQ